MMMQQRYDAYYGVGLLAPFGPPMNYDVDACHASQAPFLQLPPYLPSSRSSHWMMSPDPRLAPPPFWHLEVSPAAAAANFTFAAMQEVAVAAGAASARGGAWEVQVDHQHAQQQQSQKQAAALRKQKQYTEHVQQVRQQQVQQPPAEPILSHGRSLMQPSQLPRKSRLQKQRVQEAEVEVEYDSVAAVSTAIAGQAAAVEVAAAAPAAAAAAAAADLAVVCAEQKLPTPPPVVLDILDTCHETDAGVDSLASTADDAPSPVAAWEGSLDASSAWQIPDSDDEPQRHSSMAIKAPIVAVWGGSSKLDSPVGRTRRRDVSKKEKGSSTKKKVDGAAELDAEVDEKDRGPGKTSGSQRVRKVRPKRDKTRQGKDHYEHAWGRGWEQHEQVGQRERSCMFYASRDASTW